MPLAWFCCIMKFDYSTSICEGLGDVKYLNTLEIKQLHATFLQIVHFLASIAVCTCFADEDALACALWASLRTPALVSLAWPCRSVCKQLENKSSTTAGLLLITVGKSHHCSSMNLQACLLPLLQFIQRRTLVAPAARVRSERDISCAPQRTAVRCGAP